MNLPVFLSVLGIILIISFVLTTSYKQDKNNFDPKTNITSRSLKSLAFIQFISAPIITYIAVTHSVTLFLFVFYATILVISGLGFFHRSKFWGYYTTLSLSFIFLILSISFGINHFQQLNNALNIMFIVCVLYAFSIEILMLTIFKSHFLHNTVPYFKNPFDLNLLENVGKNKNSFTYCVIQYIYKTRLSSSFTIALIILLLIFLLKIWPLYLVSN